MTKSISFGILVLAMTACGTAAAKEGVSDSAGGEAAARSATAATVNARASSARLLAFGTRIDASIENGFTSRTDTTGQTVTAAVKSDVKDARGNVVIPSGSMVTMTIETLDPGNDQIRPEGRLALVVNSVSVNGRSYPVTAELSPVTYQMVGRGVTKDEVARSARSRAK
jgi:Flp pilus assembly protein TadG